MDESAEKKKVLIIDDDAFIGGMVAELLIESGYIVENTESGELGLQAIEKAAPDLILLDLGLTGVDGFEVLQNIRGRQEYSAIPVIVFSNFSDKEDIAKSQSLGAYKHIVKAETTPKGIVTEIDSFFSSH